MRVLVTGATSLLGRSVVTRLHERGDEVTVFQRRPSGLGVAEQLGDIADRTSVAAAVAGAEAVVHLAARVGATGSWDQYEGVNVRGTRNIVEEARQAGVDRFVHVSSPSVAHHGQSLTGATAGPSDPDRVRGHYAKSKAQAELIALPAHTAEFAVVAIRPHLVWGPGDTQLVGRIVSRARAGRLAIVGSGLSLIDTTYIDNAADALVAAVDHAPQLGGRALVVSNGEPRTVHELVSRIVAAAGIDWRPRGVPTPVAVAGGAVVERIWAGAGRTDDPPMTRFLAEQLSTAHWFDQRAARSALGWRPRVTLAEGFARLAAWYRDAS